MPNKASPSDIKDAWGVLEDYVSEYSSSYRVASWDKVKSQFSSEAKKEAVSIDISKVIIHADHGRRVSATNLDNPIIVWMRSPSHYIILDGQHRLLTLKDKKATRVNAVIIELPQTVLKSKSKTVYILGESIMKYDKYLDRVSEGVSARQAITDMIVDFYPPGPGTNKSHVPKKKSAYSVGQVSTQDTFTMRNQPMGEDK